MSWQAYVDQQICSGVDCKLACIAGLKDGNIWAQKSDAPPMNVEELKLIGTKIVNDYDYFQQNGIVLNGEKYICISAEKGLVRGRKNKNALCIVATSSTLLVGVCNDGVPPGQLNKVIEGLAEYLRNSNF